MSSRNNEKFTAAQMIEAITKARGFKSHAARILDCHTSTVTRYINTYTTVHQAWVEAKERIIDTVEIKLIDNALNGDTTAQIFFLKTQAKDRGYAQDALISADNITIKVERADNHHSVKHPAPSTEESVRLH